MRRQKHWTEHDVVRGIAFGGATILFLGGAAGGVVHTVTTGDLGGIVAASMGVFLWWTFGHQFGWLPNDDVAMPREVDDTNPADRARNYRENMARLAVTQERYAPPKPRNHFSHFECQLTGHDWVEFFTDGARVSKRCAICGHRVDTRTINGVGGYIQAGTIDASTIQVGTIRPGAAVRLPFRDRDGERVEGRDAGVAEPEDREEW